MRYALYDTYVIETEIEKGTPFELFKDGELECNRALFNAVLHVYVNGVRQAEDHDYSIEEFRYILFAWPQKIEKVLLTVDVYTPL